MLNFGVTFCEGDGKREAYRTLAGLLERELGDWGKVAYAALYKDENGKPRFPCVYGMFVSIAHTENYGAAAISDKPIGIDVEELTPLDDKKRALLDRFFAEEDITAAKDDETGKEFYRFWTRREAAFKAFADKPFYSADPVKGNEDKITSYFQRMAGRNIVFSVAVEAEK